jgi:hypothetical protein
MSAYHIVGKRRMIVQHSKSNRPVTAVVRLFHELTFAVRIRSPDHRPKRAVRLDGGLISVGSSKSSRAIKSSASLKPSGPHVLGIGHALVS